MLFVGQAVLYKGNRHRVIGLDHGDPKATEQGYFISEIRTPVAESALSSIKEGASSFDICAAYANASEASAYADRIATKAPPSFLCPSPKEGGLHYDTDKPRMDLIPYDALQEVAKVLGYGAKKYTPGNWTKGIKLSRLIGSAERHLGEFKEGRDIDPESSVNHIAHAACNMLFILWMQTHRPDMDDRYIKEALIQETESNNTEEKEE